MSQKPNDPTPSEHEEFAHEDDAIIGKAFKISGIAFLFLVLMMAVIILLLNRPQAPPPESVTAFKAPEKKITQTEAAPVVGFKNIAPAVGIDFVHNNGATGEKLLPESLGGGAAFFDLDGDGDQDLLFINSTWWPWDLERNPELKPTSCALYRNDRTPSGRVRFTNVTEGSGLEEPIYGMGVACGDMDNDGFTDLFISCVGGNKLFRNRGDGTFEDITQSAGVAGLDKEWSTAAAFFDYDRDGLLDLCVANYVQWTRDIDFEVNFTIDGTHRAYGPPTDFKGTFLYLYRNEGGGRFKDVSQESGVQIKNRATETPVAKSLGIAPIDINDDGWMDFIIANDTVPNFLMVNQQDGTFQERGAIAGMAYDSNGNARGAMGIDVAHYRNDSALGIAIGNFANEMTALFVSQGRRDLFSDEAIAEGIGPVSRLPLKFGIFFFDYDLDGWLDLMSVNGHLDEDITKVQQSQTYRQPAQLFWNRKGNGYSPVTPGEADAALFEPVVGRGSAYADIDLDGDLDVLVTQLHGPPLLLHNQLDSGHRWIRFKLIGTNTNRDAIGARVELETNQGNVIRHVMPTKSYLCQSELPITFGLGEDIQILSVRVKWPNGNVQNIAEYRLNALNEIRETGEPIGNP